MSKKQRAQYSAAVLRLKLTLINLRKQCQMKQVNMQVFIQIIFYANLELHIQSQVAWCNPRHVSWDIQKLTNDFSP